VGSAVIDAVVRELTFEGGHSRQLASSDGVVSRVRLREGV
jgi:hypothetical protein